MATILVVDDDPTIRTLCVGMLSDHTCIEAGNGHEALRQLRSEAIDLVLTDLVIPELDGVQLIEAIIMEDSHIPIIAMTGSSQLDTLSMRIASIHPDIPVLVKPFALKELYDALDPLLD